jgi:hypothetical protein
MSDPVLSQLVAVEDDLSQQLESLVSKLTALQEQRKGLRTVMDMFQSDAQPSDKKVASSSKESASASQLTVSKPAANKRASKTASKTAGQTTGRKVGRSANRSAATPEIVKATKSKSAQATSTDSKAGRKPAPKKKKDGRAADWQKHVQSDYQEAALPEAVSIVLRSQPSEIFTIANVMSSIFTEDMPRSAYLKARNRISNILSAGARDGTWYRGRNGRYSQSESVKKLK